MSGGFFQSLKQLFTGVKIEYSSSKSTIEHIIDPANWVLTKRNDKLYISGRKRGGDNEYAIFELKTNDFSARKILETKGADIQVVAVTNKTLIYRSGLCLFSFDIYKKKKRRKLLMILVDQDLKRSPTLTRQQSRDLVKTLDSYCYTLTDRRSLIQKSIKMKQLRKILLLNKLVLEVKSHKVLLRAKIDEVDNPRKIKYLANCYMPAIIEEKVAEIMIRRQPRLARKQFKLFYLNKRGASNTLLTPERNDFVQIVDLGQTTTNQVGVVHSQVVPALVGKGVFREYFFKIFMADGKLFRLSKDWKLKGFETAKGDIGCVFEDPKEALEVKPTKLTFLAWDFGILVCFENTDEYLERHAVGLYHVMDKKNSSVKVGYEVDFTEFNNNKTVKLLDYVEYIGGGEVLVRIQVQPEHFEWIEIVKCDLRPLFSNMLSSL